MPEEENVAFLFSFKPILERKAIEKLGGSPVTTRLSDWLNRGTPSCPRSYLTARNTFLDPPYGTNPGRIHASTPKQKINFQSMVENLSDAWDIHTKRLKTIIGA